MTNDIQSTGPDKKQNPIGGRVLEYAWLHFFWLAMIGLTALFLLRSPVLFQYESVALDTLLVGLNVKSAVPAAALIAAIPWVAVCVLATVITVGTIVITILGNDPIGWLDREIVRLKTLCPLFGSTLAWNAWLACRSRLAGLRTVYWMLVLAIGVTAINILVIITLLVKGLPPLPSPPF